MQRRQKVKKRISRKKKKSIFHSFYFSLFIFSSIILMSGAGFLLFSPRFQIDQLSISGNKDIASENLEKVAGEKLKTSFSVLGMQFSTGSIFLSAGKGVNALMEAFPEIESIKIRKDFPNKVSLEIVEKTPYAIWCEEYGTQKCYMIDRKGSYIKSCEKDQSLINIIEKESLKDVEKKDILDKLAIVGEKLKENSITPSSFNLFEEKLVVLSNLNCKIIFNINDDLDWQVEKLGIVIKNPKYFKDVDKLEYIDLRFGNQAIIK